jgi:hypothetical protein
VLAVRLVLAIGNRVIEPGKTHPPVVGYLPAWDECIGTPLDNAFKGRLRLRPRGVLIGVR